MTSAVADVRSTESAKERAAERSERVARRLARSRGKWTASKVIFGFVVGLSAVGLLIEPRVHYIGSSSAGTAGMQMKGIADAIGLYRFEKRSLPTSLDELTYPSEKSRTPFMEKIPLDPWKQGYGYRILDVRQGKFEISSDGEDKRTGTDDDLYYPERTAK